MLSQTPYHFKSRVVRIGGLPLGGNNPIRIQSMTNTPTGDVGATIDQCIRCFDAGADFMRISVPDNDALENLKRVKNGLLASGYEQGLVADIHFKPGLALAAAKIVEKVRINPGNYHKQSGNTRRANKDQDKEHEYDLIRTNLAPLLQVCNDYGTAIRIGTNAGSLSASIVQEFGHGAKAMVESTMAYLQLFEEAGFFDTVVSLKSSDPLTMLESYFMMGLRMAEKNMYYPLHIGVTEAGSDAAGRIRSAIGVIPLLDMGLADTIRISLTEPPENEVVFARKLINPTESSNMQHDPDQVLADLCHGFVWQVISMHHATKTRPWLIKAIPPDKAYEKDLESLKKEIIEAAVAKGAESHENSEKLADQLLQSAGLRATDTEFISCPSCARTAVDLVSLTSKVKTALSGHPGLKVAIMGCIVNGPGEMADADYGIMGTGKGNLDVYKGKDAVYRNLHEDDAINALTKLVNAYKE